MRPRLAALLLASTACLVVVAGIARAQVDQPVDRRDVPRGHGWWCYREALTTGEASFRCERRRNACQRHQVGSDASCTRSNVAYCATYAGRDLSTSRPIHGLVCMQRARDCETMRTRVYSEGRDMSVSSCTELR